MPYEDIKLYPTSRTEDAYQTALEKNIDVFLVDIVLKPEKLDDMSGMIFAESIRQVEKYRFTPIIFLTALCDPEMHAYKEIHCYGYLSKPYNKEVKNIRKTIQNVMVAILVDFFVQFMVMMVLEFIKTNTSENDTYVNGYLRMGGSVAVFVISYIKRTDFFVYSITFSKK